LGIVLSLSLPMMDMNVAMGQAGSRENSNRHRN